MKGLKVLFILILSFSFTACEKPTKEDIKEIISNYKDAQEELAEEELAEEELAEEELAEEELAEEELAEEELAEKELAEEELAEEELAVEELAEENLNPDKNECPNSMVKVIQNNGRPFCVDKNVSHEKKNLYDAYNFCKRKNSNYYSKSYYGLISNQEWMMIAREIETNFKNWSSQKIGKGKLDDKTGLLLKEGSKIYDLTDKPQWVDWVTSKGLDYYPGGCGSNDSKDGWIKFNQEQKLCEYFNGVFAIDEVFPLFPNSHSGELRILEKHHSGKFDNQGILRGASLDGKKSGLYNLDLGVYTFDKAYFRCVYRF